MSDDLDKAWRDTQVHLLVTINGIQDKKEAEPTGKCLYCGEPLKGDARWCDASCRDAWEHERLNWIRCGK